VWRFSLFVARQHSEKGDQPQKKKNTVRAAEQEAADGAKALGGVLVRTTEIRSNPARSSSHRIETGDIDQGMAQAV